jgi:hypothetical protein
MMKWGSTVIYLCVGNSPKIFLSGMDTYSVAFSPQANLPTERPPLVGEI